jgi:hypothetical protein
MCVNMPPLEGHANPELLARLLAERQALIDDGVPEGALLMPLLPEVPSALLRGSLPVVRPYRGR